RHILFLSLVFLLSTAPVLGRTLSIEHDFFRYDKESNIHTYTRPRVTYGTTTISSRELRYDKNTELMYFSGNIVIRLPDIVLTAEKATFDRKTGKNTLYKATMYDSKNGAFIEADRIEQISDEEYIIHNGALTRCKQDSKAWELRGRRIVYMVDNYAYSLSTSVHFYAMPVFYSPYFSWPTRQGRASGLLMPTFSSVDSDDTTKAYGGRLQIPYFIALDRDHDVTVTADILQRRGLGTDVDYQYAFTPDMAGQFRAWFIKETQQERDLDIEPLGALNRDSDSFDRNPLRNKYLFDHRQNIFWNGQVFFHQHENSDNEINKEYFAAEISQESHFSRTFNLIFPWDSGSVSMTYETADDFAYASIFDKTTDKDTHLNIQPSVTISQQISRIADTPLSVSLAATGTHYARTYGWNSNLAQSSIQLSAPFFIDFLNIWPSLQRTYYEVDASYRPESGQAAQDPDKYGWSIDQGDLELNFEIYRFFYNYQNVASEKLSFRPRIIYREIQDVDQSAGAAGAFFPVVLSQKTLTYKLETRYLVKNPVTSEVRTYLGLDLTQIYNLQMEGDQTYLNQPTNLETEQGDPRLPLRIGLTVSPVSLFSASLFYRWDHNKSRIVETGVGLSTATTDGNQFTLGYTNNETAYYEPDNTNHPVARVYSIAHTLRLNDRWTLYVSGEWDQNRSDLGFQYADTPDVKRLDRQLTDLSTVVAYQHDCYSFSAGYGETIKSALLKGVTTEFVERRLTLTLQFQVLPTTAATVGSTPGTQYQQGFLLPN
ncbi:hypothetical protein KKI24_12870, partial [bacterium]|nr:hypothetical protein [bacterium]